MLLSQIPFVPDQASSVAWQVDAILLAYTLITIFFTVLIAGAVLFFSIKYRRGSSADRSNPIAGSLKLELTWTIAPLILAMAAFTWAAKVYFDMAHVPEGAMEVTVVGRQWMWKIQHPTGQREINELHVPMGQPVRLIMTSQDVIHSFFVPAFRVKQDVVPGLYTDLWFEATKPGTYHLFCTEYCGTEHSRMIGTVTVMDPKDYEQWLRSGSVEESMVQTGARLFRDKGCSGCHSANSSVRAPLLEGVYNSAVPLDDGTVVMADDMYMRDSILLPKKQVAAGYKPVMPTFQNQLSEEELFQLLAYLKSLK
jgi:cytochrome c oxidase subunit II